jgi:hypothetical protein
MLIRPVLGRPTAKMAGQLAFVVLLFAVGYVALTENAYTPASPAQLFKRYFSEPQQPRCRTFPGDADWPTAEEWSEFNKTLGGKLIATVPIASACHVDQFTPYSQSECAAVQNVWGYPETHYQTSSSVMSAWYANQSCDPFTSKDAQCVVGTYVQYAVNATSALDYQNTIAFTKAHNIRLVIRNTGHDYNGKSTGAGAVAIWTHHLKDMEIIDYNSQFYTGKAIKVGAGVQGFEADEIAHDNDVMVVTGNCPTVGIAGGYTQGGGHGQLVSAFGLAADQVLEWEVVTGTGELVTASQSNNSDLYWALAGGGGGTYGVVLSMTSKVYPERQTASANLTFLNTGVTQETFYGVVETFVTTLPSILDAGGVSIWMLLNTTFLMTPTTIPGGTKQQLQSLLDPVIKELEANNMTYSMFDISAVLEKEKKDEAKGVYQEMPANRILVYNIDEFSTYYDAYQTMNPPSNVTEYQLGGRLIPRSIVESNSSALVAAMQNVNNQGAVISGVSVNATQKPGYPINAVNPVWRTAAIDLVFGT